MRGDPKAPAMLSVAAGGCGKDRDKGGGRRWEYRAWITFVTTTNIVAGLQRSL